MNSIMGQGRVCIYSKGVNPASNGKVLIFKVKSSNQNKV